MPESHDFMQWVTQEQQDEALAIQRAYEEGHLPQAEAAAFEAGLFLGAVSGTRFGANRARMDLLKRQREERIAQLGITDATPSDLEVLTTIEKIKREMPGAKWNRVILPEAVKQLGRSRAWIYDRLRLIRKARSQTGRKRSA